MLTKGRYHLVEGCTLSIKEGHGPTLGVHQTTEHDAKKKKKKKKKLDIYKLTAMNQI